MKKMSLTLVLAFGILTTAFVGVSLNHSEAGGSFQTTEIRVGM